MRTLLSAVTLFFIAAPVQPPAHAMRMHVRRVMSHEMFEQKHNAMQTAEDPSQPQQGGWVVPIFPVDGEPEEPTTIAPTTTPRPASGPEVVVYPNATTPSSLPDPHAPPADEAWVIPTGPVSPNTTEAPNTSESSDGPGAEALQPSESPTPMVEEPHWVLPPVVPDFPAAADATNATNSTTAPTTAPATPAPTTPAPTTPAAPSYPPPPQPGSGSGERASEETYWGPMTPHQAPHGSVGLIDTSNINTRTEAPAMDSAVPRGTVKHEVVVTTAPPMTAPDVHPSAFVHYKYGGHTKKYRRVAF